MGETRLRKNTAQAVPCGQVPVLKRIDETVEGADDMKPVEKGNESERRDMYIRVNREGRRRPLW